MDLRSFVRQVLQDIEGALAEHVQSSFLPLISKQSDPSRREAMLAAVVEIKHERMGDVVFDVGLTTTETSEIEGKGGISVLSGKLASESSRETMSRVQFTIHSQRRGANTPKAE